MDEDPEIRQYKRELFIKLLLMLHAGAMQHLGKITNPITGNKEVKLEIARETIDMLDLLSVKTKGNLTNQEKDMLTNLMTELHLTYVKVENKSNNE